MRDDRHEGHGWGRPDRAEPAWPYASLLLFGFFGAGTPEGRRLARWTTVALVAVVVSWTGMRAAMPGTAAVLWALVLPAGVVGIGAAYAQYLKALDELARLIQLQAFAFAYGAAMTIVAAVVAHAMAGSRPIDPVVLLPLVVGAEMLRGGALVYFAKRRA